MRIQLEKWEYKLEMGIHIKNLKKRYGWGGIKLLQMLENKVTSY